MKKLFAVLALFVVGMAFAGVANTSTHATDPEKWAAIYADWYPLLNCPDVDGDGSVSINDILGVVSRWQTSPHDPVSPITGAEYSLEYDIDGHGYIALTSDVLPVIQAWQTQCPLIESQVARATQALHGDCSSGIPQNECPDLRNWSEAQAAGYVISSQYVGQMGIHVLNPAYQAQYTRMDPQVCDPRFNAPAGNGYDPEVCQLEHPVGLVYTDIDPAGGSVLPGQLISGWYLVPNEEVCEWYGNPNPSQCLTTGEEPIGFGVSNCGSGDAGCSNPEEDNGQYLPNGSEGWHDHQGLCVGNPGTSAAWVTEFHLGGDPGDATLADHDNCLDGLGGFFNCDLTGCQFFYTYGWMMHLYNVIPNPVGRFMQWNSNLP